MQHTHITRAHLKGYRNIQDTEATFRAGLNIVIGPNGCGKSNFLWLLANRENSDLDFEYNVALEYSIYFDYLNKNSKSKQIKHTLSKVREGKNKLILKSVLDIPKNENIKKSNLSEEEQKDITEEEKADMYELLEYITLLLDFNIPTKISCFTESEDISVKPSIFSDLYDSDFDFTSKNPILKNLFKNKFNFDFIDFKDKIKQQVALYTPIKDIRVKNRIPGTRDSNEIIKMYSLLYEFQTEDGEWYVWNELSDGTRRIVWLILNILTTKANVILIEEPELGIHPHQLNLLMLFIKEQSDRKQFIVTTHSPEVLNIIDTNELDRIKIAKYDASQKTTRLETISAETQVAIQEYTSTQGFLSDYWLHLDLENTAEWK